MAAQSDGALDEYRRRLTASLSAQQRDQLTQRAVLAAAEAVFAQALEQLDELGFETGAQAVERGRSALMPAVQKPFGGFLQGLMDDVLAFKPHLLRLSNFPSEAQPAKDDVQAMLRDIAAAWQDFSLAANRLVLAAGARARGAPPAAAPTPLPPASL